MDLVPVAIREQVDPSRRGPKARTVQDYESLIQRRKVPSAIQPFAPFLTSSELVVLCAFFDGQAERAREPEEARFLLRSDDLLSFARQPEVLQDFELESSFDDKEAKKRLNTIVRRLKETLARVPRQRGQQSLFWPTLEIDLPGATDSGAYVLRVRSLRSLTPAPARVQALAAVQPPTLGPTRPLLVASLLPLRSPANVCLQILHMPESKTRLRYQYPPLVSPFLSQIEEWKQARPRPESTRKVLVVTDYKVGPDLTSHLLERLTIELVEASAADLEVTRTFSAMPSLAVGDEAWSLRQYLSRTLGTRFCDDWSAPAGSYESSPGNLLPTPLEVRVHVVVEHDGRAELLCAEGEDGTLVPLISANAWDLHFPGGSEERVTLESVQAGFLQKALEPLGVRPTAGAGSVTWHDFLWAFGKGGTWGLVGTWRLPESSLEVLGAGPRHDPTAVRHQLRERGVRYVPFDAEHLAPLMNPEGRSPRRGTFTDHMALYHLVESLIRHMVDMAPRDGTEVNERRRLLTAQKALREKFKVSGRRWALIAGRARPASLEPYRWGRRLPVFALEAPSPSPDEASLSTIFGGEAPAFEVDQILGADGRPRVEIPLEKVRVHFAKRSFDWPLSLDRLREALDRERERYLPSEGKFFDGCIALVADVAFQRTPGASWNLELSCQAGRFSQFRSLYYQAGTRRLEGAHDRTMQELLEDALGVQLEPRQDEKREWVATDALHAELPRHLQLNALAITRDDTVVIAQRNPALGLGSRSNFVVTVSQHAYIAGGKAAPALRDAPVFEPGQELQFDAGRFDLKSAFETALEFELGVPADAANGRLLALAFGMANGGVWVPVYEFRLPELAFEDVKGLWLSALDKHENLMLSELPLHPRSVVTFLEKSDSPLLAFALIQSLKFSPAAWALEGPRSRPAEWRIARRFNGDASAWIAEVRSRLERLRRWISGSDADYALYDEWLEPLPLT